MPQGITGLWQVTARANCTYGEALDMDVAYVRGWSIGLDLRLLAPHAALQVLPPESGDYVMAGARSRWEGDRLSVAVIGLGYWGPNLIRNLHELPDVGEPLGVRCPHRSRLERVVRPLPRRQANHELRGGAGRTRGSMPWSSPRPPSLTTKLGAPRRYGPASTCSSRSRSPARSKDARAIDRGSRANRIGMPGHTFLYSPAVVLIRVDRERTSWERPTSFRRAGSTSGLHQKDVSVVWALGAPRLLDSPLLAGRESHPRHRRSGAAA